MTPNEFSAEFDVLLNSYAVANNLGVTPSLELDEYEKSVLLTEAQDEIVKGLYNGTFTGESLEKTEELRRGLDSLVKTDYPENIEQDNGLDQNSKFYRLKDDVWFITYESVSLAEGQYCPGNNTIEVIPVKQDEWHRIRKNPFKKPNKRRAVRLDSGDNIVEVISEYPIDKYLIRYLRKPKPIILTTLEGDLSIDGIQQLTECELNTVLHRTILERAVILASRRLPQASK